MTGTQQRKASYKQTYQWHCLAVRVCKLRQNGTSRDRRVSDHHSCWHRVAFVDRSLAQTFVYSASSKTQEVNTDMLVWQWLEIDLALKETVKKCDDLFSPRFFEFLHRSWQVTLSSSWVVPPEQTSVRERWVSPDCSGPEFIYLFWKK